MVPMGEIEDMGALADILGCKVLNLPLKYLGYYLGAHFKVLAIWHIFLNVWRSSWQGGRGFIFRKGEGFIFSTLSNLRIYFTS